MANYLMLCNRVGRCYWFNQMRFRNISDRNSENEFVHQKFHLGCNAVMTSKASVALNRYSRGVSGSSRQKFIWTLLISEHFCNLRKQLMKCNIINMLVPVRQNNRWLKYELVRCIKVNSFVYHFAEQNPKVSMVLVIVTTRVMTQNRYFVDSYKIFRWVGVSYSCITIVHDSNLVLGLTTVKFRISLEQLMKTSDFQYHTNQWPIIFRNRTNPIWSRSSKTKNYAISMETSFTWLLHLAIQNND